MDTIATPLQLVPPPSGRPPEINLATRDVAALADELAAYHALFAPTFARAEQRRGALCYLQGQLLDLERKTIEPLALALPDGDVQMLQQFIGQSPWDAARVLARHQEVVADTLGDAETGVLIVDGCDFPKQGAESVGVARQWCGALGKVATCQASVVACYASQHGYTLVDRRLYLPEKWFTADYAGRRARCGVPSEVTFRPKPELAGEIVAAARAPRAAVPLRHRRRGLREQHRPPGSGRRRRPGLSGRGPAHDARVDGTGDGRVTPPPRVPWRWRWGRWRQGCPRWPGRAT